MKRAKKLRITAKDYLKAVKKADREIELENSFGFNAKTKIHRSKKIYNRKEGKKINFDPSFCCKKLLANQPLFFFC